MEHNRGRYLEPFRKDKNNREREKQVETLMFVLVALYNARRRQEPMVTEPEELQFFDLQALARGIAGEITYLKKHAFRLIAIVALGAPCSLTSCADQNSSAKTSSLTSAFVTVNSSASYGDPKTHENIRNAEEAAEHWRTYHFGWHGNP